MEHIYEDLTLNLKYENENNEVDIKGTVIKVELRHPLTQIQKLPEERQENANQEEHDVEIKTENQNELSIEETYDKLENEYEEIGSYIYGKSLNSEEKSPVMKESSSNKAKF